MRGSRFENSTESASKLIGNRSPTNTGRSNYGSVVRLSPCRDDNENPLPWWKRQKERIFRKKTLYMRIPILQWLPKYDFSNFLSDLVAGITVGITVIPQALAYATVAGLPPEFGLYSAYMGCFVYVILGSTRSVTIGPTALLGLVTHEGAMLMGPEAAVLLAFFTGCISLLFGILNFGFLIEFIAAPVIAGFTTAAALTIGTTQIKSFLGLNFEADGFVQTWRKVFEHIEGTQTWDAVMGISCLVALLLLRFLDKIRFGKDDSRSRFQELINGSCWLISVSRNAVIIILGSVIAGVLSSSADGNIPFAITGTIQSGLPSIRAPHFFIENGNQTFNFAEIWTNLGSSIFVTPLIAILESIAIAKSFAKGQRIDASQEMIAIGTSNLLGSLVSSYPVTGSFSRTAVNHASGVKTAFGGIYTGALVLLAITVLTPYFSYIPKSCLSAVIISAMISMVEIHLVKLVWRSRKLDLIPLFVTFGFSLFYSLEIGIVVGTAVNLAMLLYATARPRIKILKFQRDVASNANTDYLHITPDRSVVFTAIEYFMSTVRKASILHPGVPVVIDLSYVSIADFSTAYGFDNLAEDLHRRGHPVVITRAHPRVLDTLEGVRGSKLHIHKDSIDLEILLQEVSSNSGEKESVISKDFTKIGIVAG